MGVTEPSRSQDDGFDGQQLARPAQAQVTTTQDDGFDGYPGAGGDGDEQKKSSIWDDRFLDNWLANSIIGFGGLGGCAAACYFGQSYLTGSSISGWLFVLFGIAAACVMLSFCGVLNKGFNLRHIAVATTFGTMLSLGTFVAVPDIMLSLNKAAPFKYSEPWVWFAFGTITAVFLITVVAGQKCGDDKCNTVSVAAPVAISLGILGVASGLLLNTGTIHDLAPDFNWTAHGPGWAMLGVGAFFCLAGAAYCMKKNPLKCCRKTPVDMAYSPIARYAGEL